MPPKKPRKPQQSPFYFFMLDWKKDQILEGRQVPTALNLLAEAAASDWKNISEERREYYKEKSRIAKIEDVGNKFTTDGKSYAEVFAEEKKASSFNAMMLKEVNDTVSSISQNIESLKSHRFYLIHANHYCYWAPKKMYIPCEVAIAEYSIGQGVSDTMHLFPTVLGTEGGRLPLGFLHDAQEVAERIHCIPLPPWDMAEDYEVIAAKLCSFLQRSGTSEIPPLYSQENNANCNNSMSTVKDFLNNCEDFCDVRFRTYNLPLLFYELRNACADVAIREGIDPNAIGFPTVSLAEMDLDRDIFHFTRGISCPYHEDLRERDEQNLVSQNCSLATVQRWCFLISDYCCKDVGVPLKNGRHIPPSTQLDVVEATTKGFGWRSRDQVPAPSKPKNKPQFVDAPAPLVNYWAKRPQAKEEAEPSSAANSYSSAGSEASEKGANNSMAYNGPRLPNTRGRGECLLSAIHQMKLDAKNDFPPLAAGRGGGRFRNT